MGVIHIHLGVDQCLAAFQMVYHDKAGAVEVTDFFGRDETLAHPSFACAGMLSARTAGNAKCIAAFAHLLAIHIAEKYTNVASQRPDYRGGLPIARLRKIEESGRFQGVRGEAKPVGFGNVPACLNLPYRPLRFISFASCSAA